MVNGYMPISLQQALEILATQEVIPYAGGTDLMIENRTDVKYLFLKKISELGKIVVDEEYIRIGAAVTFAQALANPDVPKMMKEAILGIGSPAIRNAGTFGGNLGNGSDKADSVLIEFATDAKICLVSVNGVRTVDIDQFYRGRKRLDLHAGELIREILIPKRDLEQYYYQKVGGRNALAITFVSFAGVFCMQEEIITNIAVAFGAAGDAIQRYKNIEQMMLGKTLKEARSLKTEYIKAYDEHMVYNQSRVGPKYQRYVCMKLLEDFLTKFIFDRT